MRRTSLLLLRESRVQAAGALPGVQDEHQIIEEREEINSNGGTSNLEGIY
jgi:hypothetical protein